MSDAPPSGVSALQEAFKVLREKLAWTTRPPHKVFVFTSLDLVNSTAFKARERESWPDVMDRFYQFAAEALLNPKTGPTLTEQETFCPEVWKYAGDEVLFRTEVESLDEVGDVVRLSARAVVETHDRMEKEDHKEERRSRRLGVKGTCWIAVTNSGSGEDQSARNRIVKTRYVPGLDFLGPDIDTGFRIGKAAVRKCLVLSVELAYLLLDGDVVTKTQLRLVGHDSLKGVIDGRPYPVVWYKEDWTKFSEEFDYDEFLESSFLRQARQQMDLIHDLKDTIRQVRLDGVVEDLRRALRQARRPPPSDEATTGAPEAHVAAACLHIGTRTVMLRRRLPDANVAPGLWDFGCVMIRGGASIRHELVAG